MPQQRRLQLRVRVWKVNSRGIDRGAKHIHAICSRDFLTRPDAQDGLKTGYGRRLDATSFNNSPCCAAESPVHRTHSTHICCQGLPSLRLIARTDDESSRFACLRLLSCFLVCVLAAVLTNDYSITPQPTPYHFGETWTPLKPLWSLVRGRRLANTILSWTTKATSLPSPPPSREASRSTTVWDGSVLRFA